ASGRLESVTFPRQAGDPTAGSIVTTYGYDPGSGNLQSLTNSDQEGLVFQYDGSLITQTSASGTVSASTAMTYDDSFRPSSETVAGITIALGYDNDGLSTQLGALSIARDPSSGEVT